MENEMNEEVNYRNDLRSYLITEALTTTSDIDRNAVIQHFNEYVKDMTQKECYDELVKELG